jgi:hypothetical protein
MSSQNGMWQSCLGDANSWQTRGASSCTLLFFISGRFVSFSLPLYRRYHFKRVPSNTKPNAAFLFSKSTDLHVVITVLTKMVIRLSELKWNFNA